MKTDPAIVAHGTPLGLGNDESLFLVWGTPGKGPRSRAFARELGIEACFIGSTRRRGLLTAPFKYASRAAKTVALLRRRRPRLVFVQSPPTFAVMAVWAYCRASGARFVVDAHSGAMLSPIWTRPRWLVRALARRALATVVTNEHFARTIRAWGGTAIVIRDVPTSFVSDGSFAVGDGFNVMVVNTFAPDEPLEEILSAARGLDGVRFYVTGDPVRAGYRPRAAAPANVTFTGFLPDGAYYGLMGSVDAVVCLTTQDHTMQRGACEALSMARPIITSDWSLLREYFDRGTVHVAASAEAIRDGVAELRRDHARYTAEIGRLREQRRSEWHEAVRGLTDLVAAARLSPGDRAEIEDEVVRG